MVVENLTDSIFAGNVRTERFTVTDEDTSGSPAFDLTSFVVKYALAPFGADGNPLTEEPLFEKTTADAAEVLVTDGPNGEVEVYLVEADTVSLLGDYYFELEAFDGSGNHVVLATGTLTVKPNVVNS